MPLWRVAVFLAVVTAVVLGWHYYLWARLARDPAWPAPWPRVVGAAVWGGAALVPLGAIAMRLLGRPASVPLGWLVYGWMGLAIVTLFVLLPADALRVVAARAVDPERRLFLSRSLAAFAGVAGVGVTVVGVVNAVSRVAVERVRVSVAKLPKALSGYRILQVTDVHVGPTIGKGFIEEIVRRVNAEEPDCVVITGDLVDGSVEELGPLVEPLRRLRAKDGVFFVTGNHEYYSGVDAWLEFLPSLGIRVLRNERVPLRDAGGGGLDLAGVDDHGARQFGNGHGTDLDKALGGRDRSRALVLLAHQPKTILRAVEHAIDLQLSGHTHGGQIWPWGYAVRLDQPHVAGLARHGSAQIYVSRGTGYWGPPVRVGAPAEITRVELASA